MIFAHVCSALCDNCQVNMVTTAYTVVVRMLMCTVYHTILSRQV